ncbi:MAG: LysR substrate-binding domain-containing protein [Verrucomicrobiia bacterium]
MELRHLRYFIAVAEERGFSRAARRLRVAQPALSRQVRDLEEELGVRLLHRDSHAVSLTASGEIFLERSRSVLQQLSQAREEAGRAARGEIGKLSVAFIGSLGHELLPLVLQQFRRRHPEVLLELHETSPGEQLEQLKEARLDVGFVGMADPPPGGNVEVETLLEEPLVVALPADHPMATRKRLRLDDVRTERFLLTARRATPVAHHWLIHLCRETGFEPRVTMEVDRAPTVLNYIAAGFGVSIFPETIARNPAPGVVFVPTASGTPRYRFCLAWRASAASEVVRRFLDIAREVALDLRTRGRKGRLNRRG